MSNIAANRTVQYLINVCYGHPSNLHNFTLIYYKVHKLTIFMSAAVWACAVAVKDEIWA